jgi:transcriptional regulator with XRE-family HTH domain
MSKAKSMLSASARDSLAEVGRNVDLARSRRNLRIATLCEAAGITPQTYRRLVKGDPGVSLGVAAAVLNALNLEGDLQALADPRTDKVGLMMERARAKGGVTQHVLDTDF